MPVAAQRRLEQRRKDTSALEMLTSIEHLASMGWTKDRGSVMGVWMG